MEGVNIPGGGAVVGGPSQLGSSQVGIAWSETHSDDLAWGGKRRELGASQDCHMGDGNGELELCERHSQSWIVFVIDAVWVTTVWA